MSEQLVRYEQFEYSDKNPFQILNIIRYKDLETGSEALQHHWHSELEICYIHEGNKTRHVVDGREIIDTQGKVIVVNSDSIHNIIDCYDDVEIGHISATVFIISRDFLKELIPNYEQIYFAPENDQDNEDIGEIMYKLSKYGNQPDYTPEIGEIEIIHIKSLVYELIYRLMSTRLSWRSVELPVNKAKNLERIKGVVSYIEQHYKEPLSQSEMAKRFYFSDGYFSRYFHKTMNMTFVEYVSRYRNMQARNLLITSDKTVTEIALECGFADSRRFIISFKKQYGITPLQYRKVEHMSKNGNF